MTASESDVFELDSRYSTTRRVSKFPPAFSNNQHSKIRKHLLLPSELKRKAESGLRTRNYYKHNDIHAPLISVIIVVFNGELYLENAIKSIINQDYENIELIIIDGASTDSTLDIIQKYNDQIDYWVSEPDTGIYNAFNKAVTCMSGDWAIFLGADDYFWNNKSVSESVGRLATINDSFKIVFGDVYSVNKKGETIELLSSNWNKKKFLTQGIYFSHQGVFHHRSLFETHGYFNEQLSIASDYEILLRELKDNDAKYLKGTVIAAMRQGGISGEDRNSIAVFNEFIIAQQRNLKGGIHWSLRWMILKAHIKNILYETLGETKTKKVINRYRILTGRPRKWIPYSESGEKKEE